MNGNAHLYARTNYALTKYARTGEWKLRFMNKVIP